MFRLFQMYSTPWLQLLWQSPNSPIYIQYKSVHWLVIETLADICRTSYWILQMSRMKPLKTVQLGGPSSVAATWIIVRNSFRQAPHFGWPSSWCPRHEGAGPPTTQRGGSGLPYYMCSEDDDCHSSCSKSMSKSWSNPNNIHKLMEVREFANTKWENQDGSLLTNTCFTRSHVLQKSRPVLGRMQVGFA